MSADSPRIASYEILDQLGQGGMGTVYLALDTRLDRRVALKLLPSYLATNPSARQRFLQEARAAASLEHPSICTIYEVGETGDGQVYLSMPYYQGHTLQQRLTGGPLSTGEALAHAAEIARALARAHERGIVHRDIKPANIMLPAEGGLVILDFGVAKLPGTELTQTGSMIGTVAYMSPEQARAEAVDHRSDIWALGVVLYEMVTGRRPFEAQSEHALLYAILATDPLPVTALRPDLPGALGSIVREMLAKSPDERPGSTSDLADRLSSLASLLSGEQTRAEPQSPVVLEGERRPVALLALQVDGYDDLIERLDPDEADLILTRIRHAIVDAAERHRGHIDHFENGELLCLFGLAVSEEDDAHRAVLAAREMVEGVDQAADGFRHRIGTPIRARAGVHVGTIIVRRGRSRDRRWEVSGSPIATAERLAAQAEQGTVRESPECSRLLAPSLRSRVTPYAGRTAELGTITSLLTTARGGEGQVVWIVGDAGVGKSRFLSEVRTRFTAEGVRVLTGRAQSQSRGIPFHPFVEILSDALDLPAHERPAGQVDEVVRRVRALDLALEEYLPLYLHLLAIPSTEFPVPRHLEGEHLLSAVNEALTALVAAGGGREVVTALFLEDVQWADAATLAVLRQLADIAPAHPLLVAASGRADEAMDWGAIQPVVVRLGALDRASADLLMRAILGADRVDPEFGAWLHERTGGNPFFLEEACQSLLEEAAITIVDGTAALRDPGRTHALPETVQAVIRARIDRLDPGAREIVRVASVAGREFSRRLLEHALGRPGGLAMPLEQLKRAGLVQQTAVGPEPAYRFKHALVQEVAYDTLLEHQRRALHGAIGRTIEQIDAERIEDHVDRLAYHFSRAEAWADAVRYGIRAASRAADLSRFPEAFDQLERARGWLEHLPGDAGRRDTLADILLLQERMCETLGRRERQQELIDEVIALLPPDDPSSRLAEAHLRQGDLWTFLGRFADGAAALETALGISRDRGDAIGERNALRSLGMLRWREERHAEALPFVEQAIALDRAREDSDGLAGDLHNLSMILKGMKEYDRAMASAEEALELSVGAEDPSRTTYAAHTIANIHRELGNIALAQQYHRQADAVAVKHRQPLWRTFPLLALAHIELEQGSPEEALALYRQVVDIARKAHHAERLANALRMLGDALASLDRNDEALAPLAEAAELFGRLGDGGSRLATLESLIQIGRRVGRGVETETWCHQALELVEPLDDPSRVAALRNTLGILAWERGAFADAAGHYREALGQIRRAGRPADEGLILNSLGMSLIRSGEPTEARRVLEGSVALTRESRESLLEAHALAALGEACEALGEVADAIRHWAAAREIRSALGHAEAAAQLTHRITQSKGQ